MNFTEINKFSTQFNISDETLSDLKDRLSRTRWPITPQGEPWTYGTSLSYLKDVINFWTNNFDWRDQERRLNSYCHVSVPINGRAVHAVVMRSEEGQGIPILMAHGWPGSFVEFLQVGERLAHPERFGGHPTEGSTVIIVSLPGTGLSSAPDIPIGPREIANDWRHLMSATLNINKFVAHGSDWGAAILSWLAVDSPRLLEGIHLTSSIMQPDIAAETELDSDELSFINLRKNRGPWDDGYRVIQGTKPLTLAYGLTDSPSGLAAWLLEKFQSWGSARDTQNAPEIPIEQLLTILCLYWFGEPGPSTWIYRSWVDGTALKLPKGTRVNVPTGICSFHHDISPTPPKQWQERCYNVTWRTSVDHGGHFPGLDAPLALQKDISKFLTLLLGKN